MMILMLVMIRLTYCTPSRDVNLGPKTGLVKLPIVLSSGRNQ